MLRLSYNPKVTLDIVYVILKTITECAAHAGVVEGKSFGSKNS